MVSDLSNTVFRTRVRMFTALGLAGVFVSAVSIACSSDGVTYTQGTLSPTTPEPFVPLPTSDTPIFGDPDGGAEDGSFTKCVETRQGAEKIPIHLAISLDRSTSMCEVGGQVNVFDKCGQSDSKWNQAKSALRTFFSKPVKDVSSMTLITWSAPKDNIKCENVFDTAGFSMKPGSLLDSFLFDLQTQQPERGNYTPTSAAIDGAVRHAQGLEKTLDGSRVVSILVTDGNPTTCPGNGSETDVPVAMPAAIAAAQRAKAANRAMYIVGVGTSQTNMQKLSQALGTELFLVDVANPGAVSQKIIDAMDKIRLRSVGCELKVPNPKAGEKLDFGKVNVTRTVGGKDVIIGYSENCSNPNGWQYDVAPSKGTPKRIKLCSSVCEEVKVDTQTQLKLVAGCQATQAIN
jgi:von Willebrand factor type A domain